MLCIPKPTHADAVPTLSDTPTCCLPLHCRYTKSELLHLAKSTGLADRESTNMTYDRYADKYFEVGKDRPLTKSNAVANSAAACIARLTLCTPLQWWRKHDANGELRAEAIQDDLEGDAPGQVAAKFLSWCILDDRRGYTDAKGKEVSCSRWCIELVTAYIKAILCSDGVGLQSLDAT